MRLSNSGVSGGGHLRLVRPLAGIGRFYHVTPSENLPAILAAGLQPAVGPRSTKCGENAPSIWLFVNQDAAEDAVTTWLGDEFGDDVALALIEVSVPVEMLIPSPAAFEIECRDAIPAARLRVITRSF